MTRYSGAVCRLCFNKLITCTAGIRHTQHKQNICGLLPDKLYPQGGAGFALLGRYTHTGIPYKILIKIFNKKLFTLLVISAKIKT